MGMDIIMLGVVLWSDASDRKAVIWCEDQGDLAFMTAADSVLNCDAFFDAGDLVQFDMCIKGSQRRACNPRLVMERASTALPDALRNEMNQSNTSLQKTINIVPFKNAQNRNLAHA